MVYTILKCFIISTLIISAWSRTFKNVQIITSIIGDDGFVENVYNSLSLLQSRAPNVLGFVNRYLKTIQTSPKSGMCVWCNPPTFELNPKPENLELYWLASTIAHEAYHSYLYQTNKRLLNGVEPDYLTYSGFESERKCNMYQLDVLKSIQAPSHIIEYMISQDGTHCDLNGDGVCDDKDYALRNYDPRGQPSSDAAASPVPHLIDENNFHD